MGRSSRVSDGILHERLAIFPGLVGVLIVAIVSSKYPMMLWSLVGLWVGIYVATPDVDFGNLTRCETHYIFYRLRNTRRELFALFHTTLLD